MSVAVVDMLLDKYPTIKGVCIAGFGEPMLSDNLEPVLKLMKDRGKYVGLITNGSLLASKIDTVKRFPPNYICVSVNAPDAARHEEVTKSSTFNDVMKGIGYAVAANLNIGVSWVVTKENYKEMADDIKLANALGVNFVYFLNIVPSHSTSIDDAWFWERVITDEDTSILSFIESCKNMPGAERVKVWPVIISRKSCPHKCKSPSCSVSMDADGFISGCRRVIPPGPETAHISLMFPEFTDHWIELRKGASGQGGPAVCKMCLGNWWE
jgi:MoaA/NifB/PqqE/SkfB family radical SAM enzyme